MARGCDWLGSARAERRGARGEETRLARGGDDVIACPDRAARGMRILILLHFLIFLLFFLLVLFLFLFLLFRFLFLLLLALGTLC